MNNEQRNEIRQVINSALDRAETIWKQSSYHLKSSTENRGFSDSSALATPSFYFMPQVPPVNKDGHIISEFIALVVDMRDSTLHLLNANAAEKAKVSQLERTFYETSALLPALAQVIYFHGGYTKEYLGDGILAFFKVDEHEREQAIMSAYNAANDIIGEMLEILNEILAKRYHLPHLVLGAGLAMSKVVITVVGTSDTHQESKAFGECIYYATKLSRGKNEIFIDQTLQSNWPQHHEGLHSMEKIALGKIEGYRV